MASYKELQSAKDQLLSGKKSLRKLSEELDIDRDSLKSKIEEMCTQEERKKLQAVLQNNRASDVVVLDEKIREIIIQILKGETSAREASEKYNIDRETLRRKAEELANSSPEYIKYYIQYKSRRGDFSGINFRRLFIEMIEEGMSQTEIAEKYGIPTRTVSRELEKLGKSEDEHNQRLFDMAKIYSYKMMRKERLSEYEERLYYRILDEIKENSQFINIENEPEREKRLRELQDFKSRVESLEREGLTKQQIAERLNVGVSTIRRRLLELEEQQGLRKKTTEQGSREPDERE